MFFFILDCGSMMLETFQGGTSVFFFLILLLCSLETFSRDCFINIETIKYQFNYSFMFLELSENIVEMSLISSVDFPQISVGNRDRHVDIRLKHGRIRSKIMGRVTKFFGVEMGQKY